MQKTEIATRNAPQSIGPYSQAIAVGETLYCSGQIPIDPATGNIESADVAVQARRVFENIKAVLAAAGLDFSDTVKTTVFLTDLNDFSVVNKTYGEYFDKPYPARSCVQVSALPKGAKIEVEVVAKLRRYI